MTTSDDRLRKASEAALNLFYAAPPFEVLVEDSAAFKCIYPLAAHAIEQVRAALALIELGLSYPAEANARVALQHAVTVQWLLLTADSEHAMVAELKRNQSATLKDMASGVELPEDLLAEIDKGPLSEGPARRFWLMCERFSPDKSLYVLFRHMSDSVHPSARTLSHHLQADEERGVFGIDQTSPVEPEHDLLLTLAISAMLSLSAVEYLRRGRSRLTEVVAIAHKWEVPFDLTGDDKHPELRHPHFQSLN